MAKVLVTGASGMLGQALVNALSEGHDLILTSHTAGSEGRALDITDAGAVAKCVTATRPEWIVNAAAYTAVDRAEEDQERAHAVNAVGPENLARAACLCGARLLHVSTDFVFGGEKPDPYLETDATQPRGVYAITKEEGERRVRAALPKRHLIVRVAWLFGPGGRNFVATMIAAARAGKNLRVVADQRGTPTYTVDAARTMAALIAADARGTLHCSNQGVTTWHGLASESLRAVGITESVAPIATEDWPTPAPRPANSALENARLIALFGENPMGPWQDALRAYVATLDAGA